MTYGSATDSVTVTVAEAGTPPTANTTSPADGADLPWADYCDGSRVLVPVSGSGSDAEDGALTGGALTWSWRTSGSTAWNTGAGIGTSTSVSLPLFTGTNSFDIRLIATDGDGFTGIDTITITVVGPLT